MASPEADRPLPRRRAPVTGAEADAHRSVAIGLDVGTSSIKAVAVTERGDIVAVGSAPTPTSRGADGWEHDPGELVAAAEAVLRDVTAAVPGDRIVARVACTGVAESGVLVDSDGRPTTDAIAWFDERSAPQAGNWIDVHGSAGVARRAGVKVRPVFGAMKIEWHRQHQPAAFAAAAWWLTLPSFLAFQLTRVPFIDASLASRTMLFDISTRRWSDDLLGFAGLSSPFFGRLVESGTTVGRVVDDAAARTGLPVGTPVVAGGHDHLCAAHALGRTSPGDTVDSMGTAESAMIATASPVLHDEAVISQGAHILADRWYATRGVPWSGGAIAWMARGLFGDRPDPFTAAADAAATVPPGAGGTRFVPELHLRSRTPADPGCFVDPPHPFDTAIAARSVFEGVAAASRDAIRAVSEATDVEPRTITVTGGGRRTRLLLDIKAGMLGRPIAVAELSNSAAVGAALLRPIGSRTRRRRDEFPDAHQTTTVKPDPGLVHAYASFGGQAPEGPGHGFTHS